MLFCIFPFLMSEDTFQNKLSLEQIIEDISKLFAESNDEFLEFNFIAGDLCLPTLKEESDSKRDSGTLSDL